mgnify:CR=1 FL=1
MSSNHELGLIHTQALISKQNYIEGKNKQLKSAGGLYYGIVGLVNVYNRTYDRYHVTIPELSNAYYQNVPRKHGFVVDGGGTLTHTLSQGDAVLVSFEGGKFDNPIIVGSQFYTGNPSTFIEAAHKGTLDAIPNTILPPTALGEAAKAMATNGGSVEVKTKANTQTNTSEVRATLKSNTVVGLTVFNKTTGTNTVINTAKEVVVTNGSKYENVTGNQYSVTEGLLDSSKEKAALLAASLQSQLQTYITTVNTKSPLDITYVASSITVPGQVLVNESTGQTYDYTSKTTVNQTSSLSLDSDGNITTTSISQSSSIDYTEVNNQLTTIGDILKTSKEQTKYEQEVLLPCIQGLKLSWSGLSGLFSLSYLCNLGSVTLKASYSPIGSLTQQIDYCAPSWLSVPLMVIQGLYNLGCSNAFSTNFLSSFTSSITNQMSLMICCDTNGLPTIGFNIASSIDIGTNFAISGTPIALRDSGTLPTAVTIRPTSNTTINLFETSSTSDTSSTPSVITQQDPTGTTIDTTTVIPENTTTIDLDVPAGTTPTLTTPTPIVVDESAIAIVEPYNNDDVLPQGIMEFETPLTHLSLNLPLPTYNSIPYKVNRSTILNTPYANLEKQLIGYGIPFPELLLSELKYLVLTKSAHNFYQIMSLVSTRPLVSLVFNLINVYIQGDLNLNQYIYKLKIGGEDINDETLTLFKYAESGNLTALTGTLNNYYGIDVDILNWIYNPLTMLDWIVIQEVTIQPLFVSLQKAAIEDFCVLLVRVFNGVNLKAYDSLYRIYISLCQQALNIHPKGANFYGADIAKVYVPEVQFL